MRCNLAGQQVEIQRIIIDLPDVHAAGDGGLEAVEADRAGVAVQQREQLVLADELLGGAPQRLGALLHAHQCRHAAPAASVCFGL